MRGYFGIGVEGVANKFNIGALFRSAHAFSANFVFTIAARYEKGSENGSDTSKALRHVPFYSFPSATCMVIPDNCELVGVELTSDATDLPSFQHPARAVYVLGAETGGLSVSMLHRCDCVVKIPTCFALNVVMAGLLVMYDRLLTRGRFVPRGDDAGTHAANTPALNTPAEAMDAFRDVPPIAEATAAAALMDFVR